MGKKKNNKPKKQKFNLIDWLDTYIFTRKYLWYWTLAIILALFINSRVERCKLKDHGVEISGYVYSKSSNAKKIFYNYKFFVKEYNCYYRGWDDHYHAVGDEIIIIYLPENPKINMPANWL